MTDTPFDRGLQPERTLLAWRRTALALAVGGAIGLRLSSHLGLGAVIVGIVCIVAAVGTGISAGWRYHRMHVALVASAQYTEGGTPLAILASAALLLAAGALAFLFAGGGVLA